jgi:hypothetical protein
MIVTRAEAGIFSAGASLRGDKEDLREEEVLVEVLDDLRLGVEAGELGGLGFLVMP